MSYDAAGAPAIPAASPRVPVFLRAVVLFGVPAFWIGVIILSQTQRALFLELTREDGIIETLQCLVLFAAGIVTCFTAWRLYRKKETRWALLFAVIAFGFIAMAAEEISWGQRVFDVETPEGFFDRHNKQNETNVHNLDFVMPFVPHLISVALIFLVVLSLRARAFSRATRERWNTWLWMPPFILLPCWLCYLSYRAVRTYRSLLHIRSPFVLSRLEEPAELTFYIGLLALAVIILARTRGELSR